MGSPSPDRAAVQRVASLRLRGPRVRVSWPAKAVGPPPVLVLVAGVSNELADRLCARAGLMVLSPRWRGAPLQDAAATLEWAAEHGAELGADQDRLAVAGARSGAAHAAALALRTRDRGWPLLARQVLIEPPDETALLGTPAGVAPATVVSEGNSPYAARLRRAGVEVDELRPGGDLAGALRLALGRR